MRVEWSDQGERGIALRVSNMRIPDAVMCWVVKAIKLPLDAGAGRGQADGPPKERKKETLRAMQRTRSDGGASVLDARPVAMRCAGLAKETKIMKP